MRLSIALATIFSWTQLWAPGDSRHVQLSSHQPNCTWIAVESSTISFEVNDTSLMSQLITSLPVGTGGACSVGITPDPEFRLKAENFVFQLNNRHLACQLSLQIEDLLSNKTLALCTWPEKVLQTSVSVRIFASGEPTAEPAEYQLHHQDAASGRLVLTGTAFYRPRTCDEFKCRQSRICVPKSAVCDGLAHCPDASDESTTAEDNVCFQYNSDSFSRIGIVLTSALLISVGLVFAAVIRRTLLERLKKPSKYEVNPGKEIQYTECETSFMSPESDTF